MKVPSPPGRGEGVRVFLARMNFEAPLAGDHPLSRPGRPARVRSPQRVPPAPVRAIRPGVAEFVLDVGAGPVALAPPVFMALVENPAPARAILEVLFGGIEQGRWAGVTSALSLIETQIRPCRDANVPLADRYEALLHRRGLTLLPLDREMLAAAARVRGRYGLSPAQAVHVASALAAGCSALVTDGPPPLPEIDGLRVLPLSRYRGHA